MLAVSTDKIDVMKAEYELYIIRANTKLEIITTFPDNVTGFHTLPIKLNFQFKQSFRRDVGTLHA